jgi:hypothetical protein
VRRRVRQRPDGTRRRTRRRQPGRGGSQPPGPDLDGLAPGDEQNLSLDGLLIFLDAPKR